jgi:hypothetical protein
MDLLPALHGYPIDPTARRRAEAASAQRRRATKGPRRRSWLRSRTTRQQPR